MSEEQWLNYENRIGQLEEDVTTLQATVRELSAAQSTAKLDELFEEPGEKKSGEMAWDWPSMGPDAARKHWDMLTDWIDHRLVRYPDLHELVVGTGDKKGRPECWFRHSEAIDWLTGLYLAWRAAWEKEAAPNARITWLITYLVPTTNLWKSTIGVSCGNTCSLETAAELDDISDAALMLDRHDFIDADVRRRRP